MNFKVLYFLFTLLFISNIVYSQTTYFIKYNETISKNEVEEKVNSKQIFSSSESLRKINNNFDVNFFAKGLGKVDERLSRIIKVTFEKDIDSQLFLSLAQGDNTIEYVQPANTYQVDYIPNDSLVNEQWALEKIGAFDAWNITQGSNTVLLAIIDTGIEFFHPDLQNKVYSNPGEIPDNYIDDDDNGFIDDYMGWDFVDRVGFPFDSTGGDYLDWDNEPSDDHGHGTLVAGTAAAETNNFSGIAGVAPNIKVLNLRSFDPGGYGEEDDAAAAILYAVLMGTKVINMSWGDYSFSYILRDVIRYAFSQNVVLVASSGNQNSNLPHYPSGYSEVISVGYSTEQDFVAGSSNWGSTLDLVAPGTSITSTAKNLGYMSFNGTSAAAPFVSASAALLLSLNNFTNEEIKQILKSTSDDIGEVGWDLRSGAGRLNLFKALSITAPAIIKFYSPTQDYATSGNSIKIIASILSPYFTSFSLEVGLGFNPENWTNLIDNGLNQFSKQEIWDLNISNFLDTVYTLRIVVNQNNGRTLEERINFHIDRTPPVAELISLIPAFYGDKSVPLAAMYTNEPCFVRMFYRKTGEENFNFVTLDGFTINNQFVKQLHYGFIPKDLTIQNSLYEIFFEAENLVGLKTQVKDNGNNFIISTSVHTELSTENILPYSLPSGSIYENPINITSSEFKNIILRKSLTQKYSHIFNYINETFTEIDSLDSKIVKDFGDFNQNGLTDLLTYFVYDGYIEEQSSEYSTTFIQKFSVVAQDTEVRCWPIMAKDVDLDGIVEVFSLRDLSKIEVWDVQSDLSLKIVDTLLNFTQIGFGSNWINSPGAVVSDIDGDGINEFWMVDQDGDIFSYRIESNNTFTEQYTIQTGFLGSSVYLTTGDYDGDGKSELAVLLHSVNEMDISPYYRLIVFNLSNNNPNILFDHAILDASIEFNGAFRNAENSLRFADINNDSKDELLVFVFPYAYIFEHDLSGYKIISFKENINSNSIFIADLNQNGVLEIAFPYSNRIEFSEFATSTYVSIPYNLSGHSMSAATIQLDWFSASPKFYIYKGVSQNNFDLIDSTSVPTYFDANVTDSTFFFYAIKAYDPAKPEPLSGLSKIIEVYSHLPAKPVNAVSNSNSSVIVNFSEKMKNVIENLQSFEILGVDPNIRFPNSVSPNNQYSYLLSFRENLPAGELRLIVKDIKDLYNSPIATDTLTFIVTPTPEVETFYISSFEIINPFRIKLVFNFDVDESSVVNISNYEFEPENSVKSVEVNPNDKKMIYLNLDGTKPIGSIGREYRLRIVNLKSSGNITINSGAGSYIVLTSFAKDLSDVYVYPNPANVEKEKVTFANLPKKAKIIIFNLNGDRITEIEESDGNGGVDFVLNYESGEKLNSGIYIYRIVMLDDLNNEVDEKIGKFAVVR